jgi:hypothetical protein
MELVQDDEYPCSRPRAVTSELSIFSGRESGLRVLKPCVSALRQLPPLPESICPVTKFEYEVHKGKLAMYQPPISYGFMFYL